jgi:hypothetical protein
MSTTRRRAPAFRHVADERGEIRASAKRVRFVEIPERRYLAIDGDEPPGGSVFQTAIRSLYGVAYGLHFIQKAKGRSSPIGHLHGLYWFDDPEPIPAMRFLGEAELGPPEHMDWRLLLTIPDDTTEDELAEAVHAARVRQGEDAFVTPRVITWEEGPAAQLLHIGPYDAEYPTVERLQAEITAARLEARGCHHEIYLSDPRTPPERTRTVLRQAVRVTPATRPTTRRGRKAAAAEAT